MAAVTSAVIAGAALAYSAYNTEDQKQKSRLAGQEADRQEYKMNKEKKTQEARKEAVDKRNRDQVERKRQAAAQRSSEGGVGTDSLAVGGVGSNADSGSTSDLGSTNSGKTLLGV